jgi:hypothetical protein
MAYANKHLARTGVEEYDQQVLVPNVDDCLWRGCNFNESN